MSDIVLLPKPEAKARTERPRLYKVILLNDDYTPRDFVVTVLKAVFRMTEAEAMGVMLTAHRRGACVVAVFTREVAEQGQAGHRDGRPGRLPAGLHDREGRVRGLGRLHAGRQEDLSPRARRKGCGVAPWWPSVDDERNEVLILAVTNAGADWTARMLGRDR